MYLIAKTAALAAAVLVLLFMGAKRISEGDGLGASFLLFASGFLARELVLTLLPPPDPRDADFLDHP